MFANRNNKSRVLVTEKGVYTFQPGNYYLEEEDLLPHVQSGLLIQVGHDYTCHAPTPKMAKFEACYGKPDVMRSMRDIGDVVLKER